MENERQKSDLGSLFHSDKDYSQILERHSTSGWLQKQEDRALSVIILTINNYEVIESFKGSIGKKVKQMWELPMDGVSKSNIIGAVGMKHGI